MEKFCQAGTGIFCGTGANDASNLNLPEPQPPVWVLPARLLLGVGWRPYLELGTSVQSGRGPGDQESISAAMSCTRKGVSAEASPDHSPLWTP